MSSISPSTAVVPASLSPAASVSSDVEALLDVRVPKPRVVLESPLAGDFELNKFYARCAMRDACLRGEAPYASHLLYDQPGLLDDTIPAEREAGLEAGLQWGDAGGQGTVVYTDLGISGGMQRGIVRAQTIGRPIEHRVVPGWAQMRAEFEVQRSAQRRQADHRQTVASVQMATEASLRAQAPALSDAQVAAIVADMTAALMASIV